MHFKTYSQHDADGNCNSEKMREMDPRWRQKFATLLYRSMCTMSEPCSSLTQTPLYAHFFPSLFPYSLRVLGFGTIFWSGVLKVGLILLLSQLKNTNTMKIRLKRQTRLRTTMRNSDWRYIAQNMTLTCCQDPILIESIWFVWYKVSQFDARDQKRNDGLDR